MEFVSMNKKQYKVVSHKMTERKFTPVANIAEYFDSITSYSERTIYVWKEGGTTHEMTYGELLEHVRHFSLGLREAGLAAKDSLPGQECGVRIAVIGETSPWWIIAYMAIIASGNTVVPMDKELAPEEIAKFLEVADAAAVVYSPTFNDLFAGMMDSHPTLRRLIPMDPAAEKSPAVLPYQTVLASGAASEIPLTVDTDTERCCELLFTSGTTGTSKCVMLCQRNIFSCVTAACATVDFNKDDVLVSVLPLHHTYELACMIAGSNYGMKFCINDSLRHALKNFKEYQPTGLVLVPLFLSTMYKKILSEAKRSGKDKILLPATRIANLLRFAGIDMSEKLFGDVREAFGGRLEKIVCGGAALNPELIPIFESFGISVYEGYGITECSPLVAVTPYHKRRCGSVGTTVPCCETRIEGVETNERGFLVGEIQVRGDNVMLGYMNNEEANEAAFTDDGWFRTGDVGYKDNDGYLYITGRMKSVIVLDNGKNVFPEEIEEYLEKIDKIAESVVVGREEEDGIKLTAVVYPNYAQYESLAESDLRSEIQKEIAALNKSLPSFKQIHKLEFRKTEFEKTSSRKIKRHLVK